MNKKAIRPVYYITAMKAHRLHFFTWNSFCWNLKKSEQIHLSNVITQIFQTSYTALFPPILIAASKNKIPQSQIHKCVPLGKITEVSVKKNPTTFYPHFRTITFEPWWFLRSVVPPVCRLITLSWRGRFSIITSWVLKKWKVWSMSHTHDEINCNFNLFVNHVITPAHYSAPNKATWGDWHKRQQ